MAFENFPAAATSRRPESPPKINWMALIAGFLFLLLSFAVSYIFWYKNQTINTIEEKTIPVAINNNNSNTPQQNELQNELSAATLKYDSLKAMDTQKDSVNRLLVNQIAVKRDSISILLNKGNASQANLIKAKTLIASLKDNIEGYKATVEKVTNEKVVLILQKQAVEVQRNAAQVDLDSANTVIKQKEDSISIGATLNAENFTILSIDQRNNGKEKQTSIARKVDKLRISFEIGENRLAPSGVKQIFVCVTDPTGSPISVEALGSGQFTTRDGAQKYFTEELNINYIQGTSHQIVSFDWKQNTNFEPGDYKIEVYNNGFRIGGNICHLK